MSILTVTISQAARRSAISKTTLARTYFATPATYISNSSAKQKQEEIHQASGPEPAVYVSHEGSESDTSFNPVINHVFDD